MEHAPPASHRVQPGRARRLAPRAQDLILPAVVGAVQMAVALIASRHDYPLHGLTATDVLLLLVGPTALIARRRYPVIVMWITFLAALGPRVDRFAYISLIVSFFLAMTGGHRRAGLLMLFAGYVGSSWVVPLIRGTGTPSLGAALALGGWLAVLTIAAETVRIRRERAAATDTARQAIERERASAQRLLMARELHDVVGHNISLINLQAGVGLDLIDAQPEQAREALIAIRAASKDALGELRAMLSSLRESDADDPPPRAPSPDLARLDDLVQSAQSAGLSVTAETTGALRRLPAAVELAAYRIVQESLTNIARHAPGAVATVRLRYNPDSLDLQIENGGSATAAYAKPVSSRNGNSSLHRPGSGIAGMRERALALGGHLDARHRARGGFEISAHLPVGDAP